jgi:cytochrome c biogenesis protein CcmG/thiol:disulfide interchange protein DsbE
MRLNGRVLLAGLLVMLPLVGVLAANLGRDPHAIDSPLVGRAAPEFALRPVGGGAPVSLAALRGRPVVVNFWATWCAPCYEEHAALVETARALGSRVQFLGVVYEDTEDQVRNRLLRGGSAYPALMDPGSRTAMAFGVFGVPETYFIDAQGRIAAKSVGPIGAEALTANLRRLGAVR